MNAVGAMRAFVGNHERIWKLAFATSIAHAPRLRTMPARDLTQLDAEIAARKRARALARRARGELV